MLDKKIDTPPVDDPPPTDPPADDLPPVDDPPADLPPEPRKEGDDLFNDDPPADDPPADGIAPRPEFVPEKFWNKETGELLTEKLAKSEDYWRKHYQKVMNDEEGVPEDTTGYLKGRFNEDGDYFSGEGESMQIIPKDDPLLKAHLESSLALGLSPKQSDGYWDMMNEAISKLEPEGSVDKKAEIAKLGDVETAKLRHDGVSVFMDGLDIPKEHIATLKASILGTAQGIETMEALMAESGQLSIPLGTAQVTSTHDELMTEYDKLLEDTDALDDSPIKRARFEHLGKKLFPDDNRS